MPMHEAVTNPAIHQWERGTVKLFATKRTFDHGYHPDNLRCNAWPHFHVLDKCGITHYFKA